MVTQKSGYETRHLQANFHCYAAGHGMDGLANIGDSALYCHHHRQRIALLRSEISYRVHWCTDQMGESHTDGTYDHARRVS